jgi:hypothetical protein
LQREDARCEAEQEGGEGVELGEDLFLSALIPFDMEKEGGRGSLTRLLCWTDSGTSGLISRESSCFVAGIFWSGSGSFFFARL